jgi:hypothetical protein
MNMAALQEALEVWEQAWHVPVLAILSYFFQTEGTRGMKLIVTSKMRAALRVSCG